MDDLSAARSAFTTSLLSLANGVDFQVKELKQMAKDRTLSFDETRFRSVLSSLQGRVAKAQVEMARISDSCSVATAEAVYARLVEYVNETDLAVDALEQELAIRLEFQPETSLASFCPTAQGIPPGEVAASPIHQQQLTEEALQSYSNARDTSDSADNRQHWEHTAASTAAPPAAPPAVPSRPGPDFSIMPNSRLVLSDHSDSASQRHHHAVHAAPPYAISEITLPSHQPLAPASSLLSSSDVALPSHQPTWVPAPPSVPGQPQTLQLSASTLAAIAAASSTAGSSRLNDPPKVSAAELVEMYRPRFNNPSSSHGRSNESQPRESAAQQSLPQTAAGMTEPSLQEYESLPITFRDELPLQVLAAFVAELNTLVRATSNDPAWFAADDVEQLSSDYPVQWALIALKRMERVKYEVCGGRKGYRVLR